MRSLSAKTGMGTVSRTRSPRASRTAWRMSMFPCHPRAPPVLKNRMPWPTSSITRASPRLVMSKRTGRYPGAVRVAHSESIVILSDSTSTVRYSPVAPRAGGPAGTSAMRTARAPSRHLASSVAAVRVEKSRAPPRASGRRAAVPPSAARVSSTSRGRGGGSDGLLVESDFVCHAHGDARLRADRDAALASRHTSLGADRLRASADDGFDPRQPRDLIATPRRCTRSTSSDLVQIGGGQHR